MQPVKVLVPAQCQVEMPARPANPELLLQPEHAALSACWFFAVFKDCLPAAECGDVYDITGRVNGPKRLKLAERKAATARAYKVLSK